MEFIRITDKKLKVKLSAEECRSYGIRAEDGEYDEQCLRVMLRGVMEAAMSRTRFRLNGDRALVQLYPTEDGNAELFVTKLDSVSESAKRAVSGSSSLVMSAQDGGAFLFSDRQDLRAALRGLGERVPFRLYKSESGAILLRFEDGNAIGSRDRDLLMEYSTGLRLAQPVIEEYFIPWDTEV